MIWIVLSVFLLFVISGCGGGGDEVVGGKTSPFLGGSQGLEISFLKGSPPDEVTDGKTFDFQAVVELKNNGEFNVHQNKLKVDLVGFLSEKFSRDNTDLGNFELQNRDIPVTLLKAKIKDSEGNIIEPIGELINFPNNGINFNYKGTLRGNTPFTFRAEACYRYQTQAVSDICVLNNLVDVRGGAVCDSSGSKQVYSSASPIGITAFRQSVAGNDKIQFSFDIVHSGSGDIFSIVDESESTVADKLVVAKETATAAKTASDVAATAGIAPNAPIEISTFKDAVTAVKDYIKALDITSTAAGCPKDARVRRIKENRVWVFVNSKINSMMECVGLNGVAVGEVGLVDGKRTVTCTQDLRFETSDYTDNIEITLFFNYFDKVDKTVLVKHLIVS